MHGLSPWLIWSIAAAVLMLAEIFTTGFFIVFFGIGAIPAAVAAVFYPGNVPLQFGVFLVVSVLMTAIARPFAMRLYAKTASDEKVGPDRVIGQCGEVIESIVPHKSQGMVRVEHEKWRAESEGDAVIEAGARVEVLRVNGTRLIVKRLVPPNEAQDC